MAIKINNVVVIDDSRNATINAITSNTITSNGVNLGTAVAEAFVLANNANKSTTSDTAPANPKVGDSWFDTVTNVLLRYTNDGVSNNWIDISGPQNAGYIYQSYSITPNTTSINETTGNTVIYTVATTNITDNTVLYWTNSGTTTANDFSDSVSNGSVTIINNSGTITRSLSPDFTTETSETIILSLRTGSNTGPVVAVSTTVTVGDTSQTPFGYTIDYLTVAGGGGGADNYGGGGGAGGFADGSQTFFSGYTYTITIGGGGTSAYQPYTGTVATKGSNTTVIGSQSPAVSIVAFGGGNGIGNGGGGGNYNPAQPAGGSGGGGGYPQQAGGIAIGSPGIYQQGTQGYPGAPYQGIFNGGGGGGAAQTGQSQDGGAGKSWPFDFSAPLNNRYAGGGGGGSASPPGQWGGTGGLGGGGYGRPGYPSNSPNGGTNTGGGGGAGGTSSGGSGVVLLAVPNAQYPGVSAPGATVTTPPAAPGKTVLTYTSSGIFIA
jgi:hypothetical protein